MAALSDTATSTPEQEQRARWNQLLIDAVLNKRRGPGPQILDALGLERTIAATYSRKAPAIK
jgi:hypothetical protein